MGLWANTLMSVGIVSMISLIGIITLVLKEKRIKDILLFLISFSAGAMLGGAFIHLIPEVVDKVGFGPDISFWILMGILLFLVMEKILQWRHCHVPTSKSHPHPFGYMNLIGDAFHNFIDGMVIAGSYLLNPQLGITTTLAVILHEIPQEISDFGVLLHAGFGRERALMYNFASALAAVVGAVATLILGGSFGTINNIIVPLTAGGFIYIACSDLIPEMHKDCRARVSIMQIISFILGVGMMYLLH